MLHAKAGIAQIRPHMRGGHDESLPPITVALNSNENAYGPSAHALAAARAAVSSFERYLENPGRILASALADRFGLDARRIAIGPGSDGLLAQLARAYLGPGSQLVRSANGYLKVPNYAYANGAEVVSVEDDRFKPSVDNMIAALNERTRIVYLANPENPAGTHISGKEVRRLHAALPDNVLLVIDSAYEEYCDGQGYESATGLVEEADNVVMCRTFSKIFGLAGARVGWLYGPEQVVDTVQRIGLTFPVASPSVAAAVAALEDAVHTEFVARANEQERRWMTAEMEALGLSVVPSQTNFILVHFCGEAKTAEVATAALRRQGIALRRFASPAYREHVRITLGHHHDLAAARDALANFLDGAA